MVTIANTPTEILDTIMKGKWISCFMLKNHSFKTQVFLMDKVHTNITYV
jgi:hypothetical protein